MTANLDGQIATVTKNHFIVSWQSRSSYKVLLAAAATKVLNYLGGLINTIERPMFHIWSPHIVDLVSSSLEWDITSNFNNIVQTNNSDM